MPGSPIFALNHWVSRVMRLIRAMGVPAIFDTICTMLSKTGSAGVPTMPRASSAAMLYASSAGMAALVAGRLARRSAVTPGRIARLARFWPVSIAARHSRSPRADRATRELICNHRAARRRHCTSLILSTFPSIACGHLTFVAGSSGAHPGPAPTRCERPALATRLVAPRVCINARIGSRSTIGSFGASRTARPVCGGTSGAPTAQVETAGAECRARACDRTRIPAASGV
jgi:hypothetical protein